MNQRWPFSPWALATFAAVATIAVGSRILLSDTVARQNKALVETAAAQAALELQSTVQNLQTELRSLAFSTSSAADSSAVFDKQALSLRTSSTISVALADASGPTAKVVLAQGPDVRVGEGPDPIVTAAVTGGSALSSTLVPEGSKTYVVLAARSTIYPNLVAFITRPVDRLQRGSTANGPYRNFYIDLYNGTRSRPMSLLASTYRSSTLPPPVGRAVIRFGNLVWLVEASPKSSPTGSVAGDGPWFTLGIGLVLALALATLVEVLIRHNRTSARLADEREVALLDAQHTIVRQARLSAVGEMAAVVGHELRNPLAAAMNFLFLTRLALSDEDPSEAEVHLDAAEEQLNRASQLAKDLTAYMRDYDATLQPVEFSSLVAKVLETTPAPEGVSVAIDGSSVIRADPTLMTQVLTNVITNAYQAMPDGGTLRLTARTQPRLHITVEDDGTGIDPQVASQLFDPFVTTKAQGTGLGLAIVQRLVEAQGGTVSLENRDEGGAKLTIHLSQEAEVQRAPGHADTVSERAVTPVSTTTGSSSGKSSDV
jgi:signal transduction histidine kinase